MRKTSASVHCSGALSHGAPAGKATAAAAAKKHRHTARRVNMAGTHPDSNGLDALMPQTVVENAFVCVLAITAAVPRETPRIHIECKCVLMRGSILRWHFRFGGQKPGAAVFFVPNPRQPIELLQYRPHLVHSACQAVSNRRRNRRFVLAIYKAARF